MHPAERFAALFAGRGDAYGTGRGGIVHRAPYLGLFERHLAGAGTSIGILPLLDDGTVSFAAIDFDNPAVEPVILMRACLPKPTHLVRSRSGNWHLFAFFDRPIQAWVARGLMLAAVEAAGQRSVEVFPKQERLLPGMVGNYINLPYFGLTRMANVLCDGLPWVLTLDEFLDAAEIKANAAEWEQRAKWLDLKPRHEQTAGAGDGTTSVLHPCALKIIRDRETNPVRQGHRNVVFFNLAKQLIAYREFSDDEALDWMLAVNEAADPPLSELTIKTIFNNARRGGWRSTGCDDPLMAPYVDPDCPVLRKAGLRV